MNRRRIRRLSIEKDFMEDNQKKKIGIFGGSFNPPHKQHRRIGEKLIYNNIVNEVWYIPSYNPLKSEKDYASLEDRIEMLKYMIENDNKMKIVTDDEWNNKPIYAVDLISQLKIKYPDYEFYWIMGSDGLFTLPQWKNWKILCNDSRLKFIIFKREGYLPISCPEEVLKIIRENIDNYTFIDNEASSVSSSEIREKLREAKTYKDEENIHRLIEDNKILTYIKMKKLYGTKLPITWVHWRELIEEKLEEILEITNEYSNPFMNDAGEASDCKKLEEDLKKWVMYFRKNYK